MISKKNQIGEQYSKSIKTLQPTTLNKRETQALRILAQVLTQREIADRLSLSVSAIEHISNHLPNTR